jgi:protein associated with RNAse G/E
MIFNICKQVIQLGSELYLVKRTLKEEEKYNIDLLKQWFDTEVVLRKDGMLYFVNKIETLEYEQVTTD